MLYVSTNIHTMLNSRTVLEVSRNVVTTYALRILADKYSQWVSPLSVFR